MKDYEFDTNIRIFCTNNASQLCMDNMSQEIKRHQILNFIQFVCNYAGNEAIKSTRDVFSLTHDEN